MKTIIYGDSFSNTDACKCSHDEMWFTHAFGRSAEILNRSKSQNSADTMFLQATHDCVTHNEPNRMVIALGPLERLPMYTDLWHEEEVLKPVEANGRPCDLSDCHEYFRSFTLDDINRKTQNLFHPTYLWAKLYSDILKLHTLCRGLGHQLLVLHMSVIKIPYHVGHPLVDPLERAIESVRYISEHHSCTNLCQQAGIKPWDYDRYGWIGHHSAEGQKHFGEYIRNIITSWN